MTQPGLRLVRYLTLLVAAALLGTGCPEGATELEACEPLASRDVPLELGRVTAVGKAALGTLYVVDEDPENPSEHRLYVSEGLILVRRDVSGSGASNEDGVERLSLSAAGAQPFTLFVELRGEPTRMLIVDGPLRDKNLDIAAQHGEELEVVEPSVTTGLRVRNLAGDVYVEYSARVESTQRLIVTRPENDWKYEDFKLYLGERGSVQEQPVTSVQRARDGGSTWIRFKVGAEDAEAFFATRLTPPGGPAADEPDTLKIGTKSLEIERLPQDAQELDGLSFECLP